MTVWREVLIVTGALFPQVVTETIYALAKREQDPIIPDKIICVVNAAAKAKFTPDFHLALEELHSQFGTGRDWSPIDAAPSSSQEGFFAECPVAADGALLQDINSDKDATLFADYMSDIVQFETRDAAVRVHVSLASGRKTMSYRGGAAITLFGRVQDELSHVIVHPQDFEQAPDFWFRSQANRTVRTRDGRELDSAGAKIEIALIPFVRLRERLPSNPLTERANYANYVAEINAAIGRESVRLELFTEDRCVRIYVGTLEKPIVFNLPNKQFALFQLMAEWARKGKSPPGKSAVDET